MCKRPSSSSDSNGTSSSTTPRLLLSLESYQSRPGWGSCLITGAFFVAVLTVLEMIMRVVMLNFQNVHPLFESVTNRHILARHMGVDTVSCTICALLGWHATARVCGDLWQALWSCNNCSSRAGASSSPRKAILAPAGFPARLYTYHPAAFRISLFFFFYQVKNLYDTIVWNDGPEYIFHHVFSMLTAWGSMFPGCGHYYVPFFFGVSEISTSILCILANFDDDFGVKGLGAAFPLARVAIGSLFAVSFLVCRCILWPWASYWFCQDVYQAMKQRDDPQTKARKYWLPFFLVSNSSLSLLQLVWLFQIIWIAKQEFIKIGLL